MRPDLVGDSDEVGGLARMINLLADTMQGMLTRLRSEANRSSFSNQLVEALEMADSEAEADHVIARAMGNISDVHPMELLLADSSRAHLERACVHPRTGSPNCSVDSPYSCIAVRRGYPQIFPDAEALNACPKLLGRMGGAMSAACVPVNFMGRALGVLHVAGAKGKPPNPEQIARHIRSTDLPRAGLILAVPNSPLIKAAVETVAAQGVPVVHVVTRASEKTGAFVGIEGELSTSGSSTDFPDSLTGARDGLEANGQYYVGARAGLALTPGIAAYGKVGYTALDTRAFTSSGSLAELDDNADGFRFGGGLQLQLPGPLEGRIEYRRSRYGDLSDSVGDVTTDQVVAGLGVRF